MLYNFPSQETSTPNMKKLFLVLVASFIKVKTIMPRSKVTSTSNIITAHLPFIGNLHTKYEVSVPGMVQTILRLRWTSAKSLSKGQRSNPLITLDLMLHNYLHRKPSNQAWSNWNNMQPKWHLSASIFCWYTLVVSFGTAVYSSCLVFNVWHLIGPTYTGYTSFIGDIFLC